MSETWANYQSAIQLVAGINLALLAFPKLRQPETNHEADRWGRLLRTVPIDDPDHGRIRYAAVSFQRVCTRVERQQGRAQAACLFATLLAVGTLLWATQYADCPVHKVAAWFVVLLGVAPALYFAAHDAYVARLVFKAAARRQALVSERAL